MMKGGFSKFSRPTTAKKTEPRHKPEPTPEDDTIGGLLEELITSQKECERSGKYVEAEGFKRKIKLLREETGKRDLINTKQRHEKERKQIEDVHLEELNSFNIEWDEKADDLHHTVNTMEEELATRHEEQIRLVEEDMMVEKPARFKESAELLNLRHIEQELARQEDYMEAHKVQIRAQKLEKEELQKWRRDQTSKGKGSLNILKQKQEAELSALKQRVDLTYGQKSRQKQQEYEKMVLKYQNTLKELQFHQKQELIQFEKCKKLQQAQKRTKVGTMSSSRVSQY